MGVVGVTYLRKKILTPSLPSFSQYCSNRDWCTHCLAYFGFPELWARNAATSRASEAPGTKTSLCVWMNWKDFSYARRGSFENASRDGVRSGSPSSSSSSSSRASGGEDVDRATEPGFRTSNSVAVFVAVFLDSPILVTGTGGGSALGGTYY